MTQTTFFSSSLVPNKHLLPYTVLLGALWLFLGGCVTQNKAVQQPPPPQTTNQFSNALPAPSSTPTVRTYRVNQRSLLYRIYNTSPEPFRALLIFIRGASCEGTKPQQTWVRMSTSPLQPQSAQTFHYAMPVHCNNILINAVAIQPGQHGKPQADKRFPWLQWRVTAFQSPLVRVMIYNSSPDHAVLFGLDVIGFLCATRKISVHRIHFRQPLLPGRPHIQTIRMREICEDVRVQVRPLGIFRRNLKPNQPQPNHPTNPQPNHPTNPQPINPQPTDPQPGLPGEI
ncbi:hypothetical protein L6R29_15390 [Myxococcota bacterium]|nr:hypothetical protein [Myxococcota bacterium]